MPRTNPTEPALADELVDAFYQLLRREKVDIEDDVDTSNVDVAELIETEEPSRLDDIRLYLNGIARTPLLSKPQEQKLAREKELYVAYNQARKENKLHRLDDAFVIAGGRAKPIPALRRAVAK